MLLCKNYKWTSQDETATVIMQQMIDDRWFVEVRLAGERNAKRVYTGDEQGARQAFAIVKLTYA